jgi:hypothetical protein
MCARFPALFDVCQSQDCSIKEFVEMHSILPFRRHLRGNLLENWNQILYEFNQLNLNDNSDKVIWYLGKSVVFSTKSMYHLLEKDVSGPHNKWIWKAGIPLKIKVFMWQAFQDAIYQR